MALQHERTSSSVADRLAATRHAMFTGRQDELELFRNAITAPEPPFALLAIHGPGGTGKTMLLGEYARIATELGLHPTLIDGHAIDASPPGFLAAMDQVSAAHRPPNGDGERLVLLIDTCEVLAPLDTWFREVMLPSLPANSIAVMAGRYPPGPAWRSAPGWRDLIRIIPLRNLHPDEGRAYLRKRSVPESQIDPLLGFTHGHPLALSLVADVAREGDVPFDPKDEPDVVRALLETFVERDLSPLQRHALEIAVHARVTTESLLEHALGEEAGRAMCAWLETVPFIDHTGEGLFPHDLVRDVIETDLRWRNPERFTAIHRVVHDYLVARIRQTSGRMQLSLLHSLMFLHRNNPLWQSFHGRDLYGQIDLQAAQAGDLPEVLEIVRRHEGEVSAAIARHWFERQPGCFQMVRAVSGQLRGILCGILLDEATGDDLVADPAAEAIVRYMNETAPARPAEHVLCMRFVMGSDTYRNESTPLSSSIFGSRAIYTVDRIAWMFCVVPDPAFWDSYFRYVDFTRATGADFELNGRTYSVFAHDWRLESIEQLDQILTLREISREPTLESPPAPATPPLIVLSQAEFESSVRQALRQLHRPDVLAGNPLVRSRVVQRHGGGAGTPSALIDVIRDAAGRLPQNARTARFHDAIRCTYLDPAPSQELAAEQLDLPFSTYRRYLASGIEMVIADLWQREIG